ncbi:MAG: hypothetical protein V1761_01395, partial [bacterium]
MKSKSKFITDVATIAKLFAKAGIFGAENIAPLGAGEFNAIYAAEAAGKAYVIKLGPADSSRILTYETAMMEQEVYYYSLMRSQTNIRVPSIYFSDFSGTSVPVAYFIMERLEGRHPDPSACT